MIRKLKRENIMEKNENKETYIDDFNLLILI
jgi:hypothetical protein